MADPNLSKMSDFETKALIALEKMASSMAAVAGDTGIAAMIGEKLNQQHILLETISKSLEDISTRLKLPGR
jgi:hypothetical protein